jgi:hypothetical protein
MKNKKLALGLIVLLPGLLLLYSCNALENKTESASLLIVEDVLGQDSAGTSANYLQSDVRKTSGTITADSATVSLRSQTLDPTPMLGTTQYNDIMVDRYTVSYTRTDGRNTPGVDVPYPFEGSLSTLVRIGATTTIAVVVVREVAKMEPPLIRLVDIGAEQVLEVTAKLEFYGHDLANHNVKAVGYLSIFFANYADSE